MTISQWWAFGKFWHDLTDGLCIDITRRNVILIKPGTIKKVQNSWKEKKIQKSKTLISKLLISTFLISPHNTCQNGIFHPEDDCKKSLFCLNTWNNCVQLALPKKILTYQIRTLGLNFLPWQIKHKEYFKHTITQF